jgi:hypothetical protein
VTRRQAVAAVLAQLGDDLLARLAAALVAARAWWVLLVALVLLVDGRPQ